MVDLTTFADNVDILRFETTMQSTPITGIKPLYISDKGIPKEIFSEVVGAADLINDGTNIEASLFLTYGGASPAYSFIGDWKSQSSQVLLNYKVGFIPPIVVEPVDPEADWITPEFVGSTSLTMDIATSITQTLPSTVEEGDVLVASFMTRSVPTAPSGWTEVSQASSNAAVFQYITVFTKTAETSDANSTVVFSQADDNRIGLIVGVVRAEVPLEVKLTSSSIGYSSGGVLEPATLMATQNKQIVFSFSSTVFTVNTSTMVSASPWVQYSQASSTDSSDQLRTGAAYQLTTSGTSYSTNWEQNTTTTSDDANCIIVLFGRA